MAAADREAWITLFLPLVLRSDKASESMCAFELGGLRLIYVKVNSSKRNALFLLFFSEDLVSFFVLCYYDQLPRSPGLLPVNATLAD